MVISFFLLQDPLPVLGKKSVGLAQWPPLGQTQSWKPLCTHFLKYVEGKMFESRAAVGLSSNINVGCLFFWIFTKELLPEDLCTPAHTPPPPKKKIAKIHNKNKTEARLKVILPKQDSFLQIVQTIEFPTWASISHSWWILCTLCFILNSYHIVQSSGLRSVSSPSLPTKWWVHLEKKNSVLVPPPPPPPPMCSAIRKKSFWKFVLENNISGFLAWSYMCSFFPLWSIWLHFLFDLFPRSWVHSRSLLVCFLNCVWRCLVVWNLSAWEGRNWCAQDTSSSINSRCTSSRWGPAKG